MEWFKQPQPPQTPSPLKDYTPEFDSLNNNLQQLSRMMQQYFQAGQAKESRYSLHTFDSGVITIDTHGYRYVGIFVALAQTITVTLAGLSYSISLQPGLNRLNLVDGTQLSTSTPFSFVLYYSDYPFAEDSEGVAVNNTASVQVVASSIMQPVDIQSHLATTIQTHNAVSVAASAFSTESSFHDANGYNTLGFTLLNDNSSTSSQAVINWSNDGSTIQGAENLLTSGSAVYNNGRAASTTVKARYFKITIQNGDTAAHTMSAWAYLLA